MQPKALIFDVFGTLTDWRTSITREARAALEPLGHRLDWTGFATDWRSEYDPAMDRIRAGNRGYVPLDDLHAENLVVTARAHGIAAPDPSLARAWERLDTWPDVVPGLNALKYHAIIAPCSNGSIALMTHLARHAGLPWDCILGADIARDYKPKPGVYQAAAAALRLPPEQVMMVAAHNADLLVAHECGLQTAFIPRPTEHGPDQSIDLVPNGPWTAVAPSLTRLATQLFGTGTDD